MAAVEMNNWELATHLAAEHPCQDVLYLCGAESSVVADSIRLAKPDVLLPMPFTPVELVERVQRLSA
jgi:hypothetical protein